jgi:hypothetical protein
VIELYFFLYCLQVPQSLLYVANTATMTPHFLSRSYFFKILCGNNRLYLARRMSGGAAYPIFSCFIRQTHKVHYSCNCYPIADCVWASYSAILAVPGLPAGQRVRASRRLRQETKLLILKKLTFYFIVFIKYIFLLILERYLLLASTHGLLWFAVHQDVG